MQINVSHTWKSPSRLNHCFIKLPESQYPESLMLTRVFVFLSLCVYMCLPCQGSHHFKSSLVPLHVSGPLIFLCIFLSWIIRCIEQSSIRKKTESFLIYFYFYIINFLPYWILYVTWISKIHIPFLHSSLPLYSTILVFSTIPSSESRHLSIWTTQLVYSAWSIYKA